MLAFRNISMTKMFCWAALVLGLGCLAYGWFGAGYGWVGLVVLALLPFSLAPLTRKFQARFGLVLSISVLAAAIGLWVQISLALALTAVVCVLAAWDLDYFSRRLAFAAPEDDPQALERRHLTRVSLALLLGLGLNLLSMSIRFQFGFEWILLLAILAFFGIGALFNAMRPAAG